MRRLCTCLWGSRGCEGSEAPAGLFSTEFCPRRHQSHYTQQPSTDWLHSAAVLEIEFFLSPTGTNHIAFTLFIPLFCHTRRHADTQACRQLLLRLPLTHIHFCGRRTFSYMLCLKYLIQIYLNCSFWKSQVTVCTEGELSTGTRYKSKYTGTKTVLPSAEIQMD